MAALRCSVVRPLEAQRFDRDGFRYPITTFDIS